MNAVREAIKAVFDNEGMLTLDPYMVRGAQMGALIDALVRAVEAVPVVPPIEGNGSMDGVTPILFFGADSTALVYLRHDLSVMAAHVRITIDDGLLKWKVGEGTWCSGYPSERANGGNG